MGDAEQDLKINTLEVSMSNIEKTLEKVDKKVDQIIIQTTATNGKVKKHQIFWKVLIWVSPFIIGYMILFGRWCLSSIGNIEKAHIETQATLTTFMGKFEIKQ